MRFLPWTPFSNASVPQQLQGEFRKLVFVGASPTGGPIYLRCTIYDLRANGQSCVVNRKGRLADKLNIGADETVVRVFRSRTVYFVRERCAIDAFADGDCPPTIPTPCDSTNPSVQLVAGIAHWSPSGFGPSAI